jgi:hypothetical protein
MRGAGTRGAWCRSHRGRSALSGALLALLSGCGLPGGETPSPEDPCRILPAWVGGEAEPVIGVVDPVDFSLAPHPRSDGEGLLFATIHPPLVRLDCRGRLQAGVAAGWEPGEPGEWRLAIPGARERGDAVARALARGTRLEGGVELAAVERTPSGVVVRFRGEGVEEDGAGVLAERGLVPVAALESGWGSRLSGLRLVPVAAAGSGVTLHLVAGSGEGEERLAVVRVVPGGDPRDLLDEGVHLVLTRDPVAVAWGRSREGIQAVALPPDRIYRLALPGGGFRTLPPGLSAGLVRDVVPLGRVPSAPGPVVPEVCPTVAVGTLPPVSGGVRPRVVHPLGDPVARALAERVAALAGPGGSAPLAGIRGGGPESNALLEVVGLDPARFQAALREGRDAAYLVHGPVGPAAPCTRAASRAREIPWLDRGSLLSLVEVGPHALIRAGAPALEVDGTGAVRMLLSRRLR